MCYLAENIIPGKTGRTFFTRINNPQSLLLAWMTLKEIKGIGKIDFTDKVFPHEITIFSESPIPVKQVRALMKKSGFLVVPKPLINLIF